MKKFEMPSTRIEGEEEKEKIKKLDFLIMKKMQGFMDPCVAGRFGDDHFSFDAASYYTLIDLRDGAKKLLKIGWGEMSSKTFLCPKEESPYPESIDLYREFPLPIYCLSQADSYLSDSRDREEMKKDPVSYLQKKAIFVYDKKGLGFVGNEPVDPDKHPWRKELKIENLPSVNIDKAISEMKNFND